MARVLGRELRDAYISGRSCDSECRHSSKNRPVRSCMQACKVQQDMRRRVKRVLLKCPTCEHAAG